MREDGGEAPSLHSEQELASCHRRLELLEERLDEILSVVSHQLRTPMASLLGFTELLLDREYTPERQRHLLENVHRETRRLTDLLGDFLDVQALESGRVRYDFQPVNLAEVLDDVAEVFAGKSPIRLEVASTLPPVRADRDRLQQVLSSLVANAVCYSPAQAEVLLTARRQGTGVLVRVVDRGVGVPEDDRERIFERFVRSRNVPGETNGAGLGLAIARRIIEDHRGEIHLESELGSGSTFSVALPLAATDS